MPKEFEQFMLSQKALLIRDGKCLIVHCSYPPNDWELPGGRVDQGEDGKEALQREVKEELGIDNFEEVGIVDYEAWYTKVSKKAVCSVVVLIKNNESEIILSEEHQDFKWISADEVDELKYSSPNMARMIKKGFALNRLLEKNEK